MTHLMMEERKRRKSLLCKEGKFFRNLMRSRVVLIRLRRRTQMMMMKMMIRLILLRSILRMRKIYKTGITNICFKRSTINMLRDWKRKKRKKKEKIMTTNRQERKMISSFKRSKGGGETRETIEIIGTTEENIGIIEIIGTIENIGIIEIIGTIKDREKIKNKGKIKIDNNSTKEGNKDRIEINKTHIDRKNNQSTNLSML